MNCKEIVKIMSVRLARMVESLSLRRDVMATLIRKKLIRIMFETKWKQINYSEILIKLSRNEKIQQYLTFINQTIVKIQRARLTRMVEDLSLIRDVKTMLICKKLIWIMVGTRWKKINYTEILMKLAKNREIQQYLISINERIVKRL